MRHSINRYRKPFVNTEAVDVQRSQGYTSKSFELSKNIWSPFTQAVLYKGEFRYLTLPSLMSAVSICTT